MYVLYRMLPALVSMCATKPSLRPPPNVASNAPALAGKSADSVVPAIQAVPALSTASSVCSCVGSPVSSKPLPPR